MVAKIPLLILSYYLDIFGYIRYNNTRKGLKMPEKIDEIDLSPLVKELVSQGFTITKIEGEPNPFDKATEILEKHGYKVERPVQRSMKQDIDELIKEAQAKKAQENQSKDAEDSRPSNFQSQKSEESTETKIEKKDVENIVKLLIGTPTESTKEDKELNEEKIQAMTPEQIQENMPAIREYILANGGEFSGN